MREEEDILKRSASLFLSRDPLDKVQANRLSILYKSKSFKRIVTNDVNVGREGAKWCSGARLR